jgi:hypothetical protein
MNTNDPTIAAAIHGGNLFPRNLREHGPSMSSDSFRRMREIVRLASMRSAEASALGLWEQREHAVAVAWEYLEEALDYVDPKRPARYTDSMYFPEQVHVR